MEIINSEGWLVHKEPDPPVNVRVVLLDGTEVPIELIYVGFDPEQLAHRWEQIHPEPIPVSVWRGEVRADKLPGHTLISIALDEDR